MTKWLYSKIWSRWLWNDYTQSYDIILEVLGWRTARVCDKWHMNVVISTPCFKIFGIKFD